jgi:hypothetical protein
LGPAAALPFAGKVDIWADHAGAFDCGVLAASPVGLGRPLPAAEALSGVIGVLMLKVHAPRPGIRR